MTRQIAIFGAGGFAREVLQIILDINAAADPSQQPWKPVGFVVDPAYVKNNLVQGMPILGSLEWIKAHPDVEIVVAVGSPADRFRIVSQINANTSNKFSTLVHPHAWVGRNVTMGAGTVICAGALITTDIHLGKNVHVNIGCTIGHDSNLCDFTTLNPSVNISGNTQLGFGVEMGTRSVLIPHVFVGDWSIVGAGAVVTKSIPANSTAVGTPARVIKTRGAGWQLGTSN